MSHPDRDSGFTLVEVMVAISLVGIMMAIAVGGFRSWADASAHQGTARELQSVMRQAQQRAVTEGRAMCVDFNIPANEYNLYLGACDVASRVLVSGPMKTEAPQVRLATPVFTAPSGTTTGVTFYARGTAWPGTVKVTRDNSAKVYTLSVEGLTGRVSLS